MKKLKSFYSIILIICIPILVLLIGLNIALRSPEVYSYYLNDSQALDYTTLALSSNEMADQLADFSWDLFSNEINIVENAGYMDDPVFDDTEAEVLFEMREYLSKSFVLMVALLVLIGILYVYFIKKEYKKELASSCTLATLASIVILALSTIMIGSDRIAGKLYNILIGIDLPKESILRLIFTKGDFTNAIAFSQMGIGIIALIIICYITWRLTKPPSLYKRR